jgi:putative lipoprotein (rSAM/lipoprotein system)
MKNTILRSWAVMLSFLGFMVGFTSKVLAQYGAPVMHFQLLGQIKSIHCNEPIGGVEVTLVNDYSGQITKVKTDSNGNFHFKINEQYWEYEYTMNLTDINEQGEPGQYVSKSVHFSLNNTTDGVSTYYWNTQANNKPMEIFLDYNGENPCSKDSIISHNPEDSLYNDSTENAEKTDFVIFDEKHKELINNEEEHINPKLYPNPSDGNFFVEFYLHQETIVTMEVYTMNGKLIKQLKIEGMVGKNTISVAVKHLSSQILPIKLTVGNKVFYCMAVLQ